MASPKSDEELPAESGQKRTDDPVERPGVYVQVVGTPRRRKSSSNVKALESGSHLVDDVSGRARTDSQVRRGPGPMGMGTGSAQQRTEPMPRTQSEVRDRERVPSEPSLAAHVPPVAKAPAAATPLAREIVEIQQPLNDPRAESENTNHRADIVRVSAPPRYSAPPAAAERLSAPSVLDAKASLRTDPPAPARTPWALIASVAIMSAIIASAGVVALQEWRQKQSSAEGVTAPVAPVQVAPKPAPSAVVPPPPAPAVVEAPAPPVAAAPEPAPVPEPAAPAPPAKEEPVVAKAPEPVKEAPVAAKVPAPAPQAVVTKPAKPASKPAVAAPVAADDEPSAIPRNPYPANAVPPAPVEATP